MIIICPPVFIVRWCTLEWCFITCVMSLFSVFMNSLVIKLRKAGLGAHLGRFMLAVCFMRTILCLFPFC